MYQCSHLSNTNRFNQLQASHKYLNFLDRIFYSSFTFSEQPKNEPGRQSRHPAVSKCTQYSGCMFQQTFAKRLQQ